jgi:hypothetical protein|nr:MAG TPA: helix-turn-helix domain protein [Caudoviricetes sp.]
MNYIAQMNAFYDCLLINPLSPNANALYGALLHINNKTNWLKIFTVAITTISSLTGLNKQAIERARKELIQKGYIKFKNGKNQYSAGKYAIIELQKNLNQFNYLNSDITTNTPNDTPNDVANNITDNTSIDIASNTVADTADNIANDTPNDTANNIASDMANDTINKHKHKQIKKEKREDIVCAPKVKTFDELIESYTSDDKLRNELKQHLSIRKKKGALTNRALELGLHNLTALTNKIESEEASTEAKILIVQQSIRNGYAEFYPLKQTKKQEGGINYNYAQRKADEATLEQLYDN